MAFTLPVFKGIMKISINDAAMTAITGGFESSALGESYRYDSDEHDQLNLIGATAMGAALPYRCLRISDGVEDYVMHTTAQLQQVLADGAVRKLMILQTAKAGRDNTDAAVDEATAQAAADVAIGSIQAV